MYWNIKAIKKELAWFQRILSPSIPLKGRFVFLRGVSRLFHVLLRFVDSESIILYTKTFVSDPIGYQGYSGGGQNSAELAKSKKKMNKAIHINVAC